MSRKTAFQHIIGSWAADKAVNAAVTDIAMSFTVDLEYQHDQLLTPHAIVFSPSGLGRCSFPGWYSLLRRPQFIARSLRLKKR